MWQLHIQWKLFASGSIFSVREIQKSDKLRRQFWRSLLQLDSTTCLCSKMSIKWGSELFLWVASSWFAEVEMSTSEIGPSHTFAEWKRKILWIPFILQYSVPALGYTSSWLMYLQYKFRFKTTSWRQTEISLFVCVASKCTAKCHTWSVFSLFCTISCYFECEII